MGGVSIFGNNSASDRAYNEAHGYGGTQKVDDMAVLVSSAQAKYAPREYTQPTPQNSDGTKPTPEGEPGSFKGSMTPEHDAAITAIEKMQTLVEPGGESTQDLPNALDPMDQAVLEEQLAYNKNKYRQMETLKDAIRQDKEEVEASKIVAASGFTREDDEDPQTPNSASGMPERSATTGDSTDSKGVSEDTMIKDRELFAKVTKGKVSTDVAYSAPLATGFEVLTASEGTDLHIDGRNIITLPYGVVPSKGVTYKGKPIDVRKHSLTEAQLKDVDYSKAEKNGIKRTDYDSDEEFAKAVWADFAADASRNLEGNSSFTAGWDSLGDKAKQFTFDMGWNGGLGALGWGSVGVSLQETTKPVEQQKTSNLIKFARNFKSGSKYPRGLLKRRLMGYNLIAKEGDKAYDIKTIAVNKDGKRVGTAYKIRREDGTVIETFYKGDVSQSLGILKVPQ